MSAHDLQHGRIRARGDDPGKLLESIAVTLAGTEHVLPLADALGLANGIIMTVVDRAERHMRDRDEAWP